MKTLSRLMLLLLLASFLSCTGVPVPPPRPPGVFLAEWAAEHNLTKWNLTRSLDSSGRREWVVTLLTGRVYSPREARTVTRDLKHDLEIYIYNEGLMPAELSIRLYRELFLAVPPGSAPESGVGRQETMVERGLRLERSAERHFGGSVMALRFFRTAREGVLIYRLWLAPGAPPGSFEAFAQEAGGRPLSAPNGSG